jgi:hypothetical protein
MIKIFLILGITDKDIFDTVRAACEYGKFDVAKELTKIYNAVSVTGKEDIRFDMLTTKASNDTFLKTCENCHIECF